MDPELYQQMLQYILGQVSSPPAPMPGAPAIEGRILPPESQYEGEPYTVQDQAKGFNAGQDFNQLMMDPFMGAMASVYGGQAMLAPGAFEPTPVYNPVDPEMLSAFNAVEKYRGKEPSMESIWPFIAQGLMSGENIDEMLSTVQLAWGDPEHALHGAARADVLPTYSTYALGEDNTEGAPIPDFEDLRTRARDMADAYGTAKFSLTDPATGDVTYDPSTGRPAVLSFEPNEAAQSFRDAGYNLPTDTYDPGILAAPGQLQGEDEAMARYAAMIPEAGDINTIGDQYQGMLSNATADREAMAAYEQQMRNQPPQQPQQQAGGGGGQQQPGGLNPSGWDRMPSDQQIIDFFTDLPSDEQWLGLADRSLQLSPEMMAQIESQLVADNGTALADIRGGGPRGRGMQQNGQPIPRDNSDLVAAAAGALPSDRQIIDFFTDLPSDEQWGDLVNNFEGIGLGGGGGNDWWRDALEGANYDVGGGTPQAAPQAAPQGPQAPTDWPGGPTIDPDRSLEQALAKGKDYYAQRRKQMEAYAGVYAAQDAAGQREYGVNQLADMGFTPFAEQMMGRSMAGGVMGLGTGGMQPLGGSGLPSGYGSSGGGSPGYGGGGYTQRPELPEGVVAFGPDAWRKDWKTYRR